VWSRILELVGRGYRNRAAAQAVRLAFEARYPEAESTDVWLRAHEADRDVVAVLYRDRAHRTMTRGMPLYRLFAIRRDLTTEELPAEPDSPYLIRGIK
jgi:hypothetical protein